jgi:putative transcriptional regulator
MKTKKMSPLAVAIAEGLQEAISYTTDEKVTGVNVVEVEVPDVKEIRLKLNMTQEQFSSTFRIPSGTVKGWEQKRRGMDATSAAFLRVIEKYPEQVKDALRSTLAQA